MSYIRRLSVFDKNKIREIVKSNSCGSDFKYPFLKEIFCLAQSFLPLKYKFLPETFVSVDKGELTGVISVKPVTGNSEAVNILQLIFANENYDAGKELVNFIVEYYGLRGAKTFKVIIDNNEKDLENLFMDGCGFRCGSWENIWDVTSGIEEFKNIKPVNFSQMSDGFAPQVAELINFELLNHYKPALKRKPEEFKSPLIEVFNNARNNCFVKHFNKNVCAYLNIQTNDNKNFVVIPYKSSAYDVNFDEILAFAVRNITRFRLSDFNLYVCQQKNMNFSTQLEEYLHSHDYECVNTSHILIKEFYKPAKQEYQSFIFGENRILLDR